MFDKITAQKIQDAISKEKRAVPDLKDIMFRMTLVPAIASNSDSVWALQYGDLTILVSLTYDACGDLKCIRTKMIAW